VPAQIGMAHAGGMARGDAPVLVTTAAKSPRQEQRERERRYLVTMGIRVLCWIGAIVLFGVGLRWEGGIAVAGSLVLPWVAVIAANGGPKPTVDQPVLYRRHTPRALDRGDD
jgi:hypothetical protein